MTLSYQDQKVSIKPGELHNVYVCPAGKTLKSSGRLNSDNTYRYLASTYDCGPCPLKKRCCPKTPQRKIPRDFNQSRRDRKKVEMLFAHLKRILKLGVPPVSWTVRDLQTLAYLVRSFHS